LTARCCESSAEPVIGCGFGVPGTTAISVAEVLEKRCGASAAAIAQASSARDVDRSWIENMTTAPLKMF